MLLYDALSIGSSFVFERQRILQIVCQHKIGMYNPVSGDLREH